MEIFTKYALNSHCELPSSLGWSVTYDKRQEIHQQLCGSLHMVNWSTTKSIRNQHFNSMDPKASQSTPGECVSFRVTVGSLCAAM